MTEATCSIRKQAARRLHAAVLEGKSNAGGPRQGADPGVGGTTGVGGPSLHPAFRVSCIPATRPWKGNVTTCPGPSVPSANSTSASRLEEVEGGQVPEAGGEQLCISWHTALLSLLARRSRHLIYSPGKPAVVLNFLQTFLSLRKKVDPVDSEDFRECLREPHEQSPVPF